jgi:hypothetical protein
LNLLYQRAIEVASTYLGPASERFLKRQITQHLEKDPEALSSNDIPELAKWVHVSVGPSVADPKVADSFRQELLGLV